MTIFRKRLSKPAIAIIAAISLIGLASNDPSLSQPKIEIETNTEQVYFSSRVIEDENLREGTQIVQKSGKHGRKEVQYEVSYVGGKESSRQILNETIITEPSDEIIVVGTKKIYLCSNGVEFESIGEKEECEKRILWENEKNRALLERQNDSSKTKCWYDEYPGTTLHWEYYVKPRSRQAPNNKNGRTGAICRDGTRSSATGRGACSHHGGVARWLY